MFFSLLTLLHLYLWGTGVVVNVGAVALTVYIFCDDKRRQQVLQLLAHLRLVVGMVYRMICAVEDAKHSPDPPVTYNNVQTTVRYDSKLGRFVPDEQVRMRPPAMPANNDSTESLSSKEEEEEEGEVDVPSEVPEELIRKKQEENKQD